MADVTVEYIRDGELWVYSPHSIGHGDSPINFGAKPGSNVHDFQVSSHQENSAFALFSLKKCSPLLVANRGQSKNIEVAGEDCRIKVTIDNRFRLHRAIEDAIRDFITNA